MTRLLARSSERAQLLAQLRHPKVRLLTLTGPYGVGKTRLALSAAHDLVISPRTFNHHTRSLYSKPGVSSRAATRAALEQHVL